MVLEQISLVDNSNLEMATNPDQSTGSTCYWLAENQTRKMHVI
jgi:hypothetical protein